jgi:hypothetical protein
MGGLKMNIYDYIKAMEVILQDNRLTDAQKVDNVKALIKRVPAENHERKCEEEIPTQTKEGFDLRFLKN